MNLNNIKVTTTSSFEGVEILEYLEPVTAHVVVGMNFFKDFLTGITDFFGGNSDIYQDTLSSINEQVINELRKKAYLKGANCVLGFKIDNDEISAQGKSMMMVTGMGTAAIADFPKESTNFNKKLKLQRIIEEIENLYSIEIDKSKIANDLRIRFNLSDQDFQNEIEEAIKVRENHIKLLEEKGISLKEEKEIELIENNKIVNSEFSKLNEKLKNDEIIIKMKNNNEFKIIKKSKHELNKELHLSSKYVVLNRN